MAAYEFQSTWRLQAPIEAVWDVIADWRRYPAWWRGVVSAEEVEPGDADGHGGLGRVVWQAPIGYRFTVDMRETLLSRPTGYAAIATGDLAGTGTWKLAAKDGVTTVGFTWRVRTTLWWVNLLSPICRPLFMREHDRLMGQGAQGLAARLNARLLHDEEH